MDRNPFSEAEIAGRLWKARKALAERALDAAVFASPENIFYLTGLDHWGYFAPHLLIVTLDRQAVLVTRSMEKVTIFSGVWAATSSMSMPPSVEATTATREVSRSTSSER